MAPWVSSVDHAILDGVSFLVLLVVSAVALRMVIVRLAAHMTWEGSNGIVQGLGLLMGGVRGLWWAGLGLLMLLATGVPYIAESIQQRSLFSPTLVTMFRRTLTRTVDVVPGPGTQDVLIPSLNPPKSR